MAAPKANPLLVFGLALVCAIGVCAFLVLRAGAELDAPTLALSVACASLVYALRAAYGVVEALARPATATPSTLDAGLIGAGQGPLREEKRRVLRALKELEFDHAMGKLSEADYTSIRDHYRARAATVLHALDEGGELHPDLVAATAGFAGGPGAAGERSDDAPSVDTVVASKPGSSDAEPREPADA